jgi:antirestriction protein ArdC
MYLSFLVEQNGWNDPRFYTMNSLGEGMQVKKGSKSTIVIYNKATKRDVEDEATGEVETKTSWFQRYYRVFNGSQIDGLDTFELPEVEGEGYDHEDNGYPEADLISTEWCDTLSGGLRHGSDRAFYTPQLDSITMPDVEQFETLEAYYHTLFHEIAHSTGHESRTNRLDLGTFGKNQYAKEELVAEFAAAFMCANTGVPLDDSQSAAYLKTWAARCKDEPKLLFSAANAASYAADMIMENTYAVA